jgi:hypothetical protein
MPRSAAARPAKISPTVASAHRSAWLQEKQLSADRQQHEIANLNRLVQEKASDVQRLEVGRQAALFPAVAVAGAAQSHAQRMPTGLCSMAEQNSGR